jgi:hypothetical protein
MSDMHSRRTNSRDLQCEHALDYIMPGPLLYDQYAPVAKPDGPEFDLLHALMENGLEDIRGRGAGMERRRHLRLATEAVDWVLSDNIHYGSFVYCCQHLSLDVSKTRTMFLGQLLKGKQCE